MQFIASLQKIGQSFFVQIKSEDIQSGLTFTQDKEFSTIQDALHYILISLEVLEEIKQMQKINERGQ